MRKYDVLVQVPFSKSLYNKINKVWRRHKKETDGFVSRVSIIRAAVEAGLDQIRPDQVTSTKS